MTEIQSLSDNDTIWQQFLPSVGAGYRQTFSKFQDGQLEKILSSLLQIGHDIPEEKANKISNDFFNSSLHDFCTRYLKRSLKHEDHHQILTKAQEIIKSNRPVRIDEKTPLIDLLAAKTALNAHDVSNHMLANACFLGQFNALPPDGETILKNGISPALYEDHVFFNRADKTLKEATKNAPTDAVYNAFNRWFMQRGFKCIPSFNQYGSLIKDMRIFNALIVKKAILDLKLQERHPHTTRRPRPINRSWRGEYQ